MDDLLQRPDAHSLSERIFVVDYLQETGEQGHLGVEFAVYDLCRRPAACFEHLEILARHQGLKQRTDPFLDFVWVVYEIGY